MPIAQSARVHPSAVIAPEADLGEEVQVGPHVVIEGPVRVGAGCVLRPGAHLVAPLSLGRNNVVFSHAVLGEQPQHLKYEGELTRLEIGDHNVFREHVTVHRATTHSWVTRIGSHNFFMANSHVAHDCQIGNQAVLANGALVAGFVSVGDRAFVSGNVAIHQFARIGRLAMVGGLARITQDCLPFMITEGSPARARGLNIVGLRRAGVPAQDVAALKKALALLRSGLLLQEALAELDGSDSALVRELAQFIRESKRGFSHPSAV